MDEPSKGGTTPGIKDVFLVVLCWLLVFVFLKPPEESSASRFAISKLLEYLSLGLALGLVVCFLRRQPLGFFGLTWSISLADVWKGIGLGVLVYFINIGIDLILTMLGFKIPSDPRIGLLQEGLPGFLSLLAVGGILAPIFEEVFYRGFLYQAFKRKLGLVGALIGSSLVFGLAHLPGSLIVAIEVFCFGAVLCYIFQREKKLTIPIFAHASYNVSPLILAAIFQGAKWVR